MVPLPRESAALRTTKLGLLLNKSSQSSAFIVGYLKRHVTDLPQFILPSMASDNVLVTVVIFPNKKTYEEKLGMYKIVQICVFFLSMDCHAGVTDTVRQFSKNAGAVVTPATAGWPHSPAAMPPPCQEACNKHVEAARTNAFLALPVLHSSLPAKEQRTKECEPVPTKEADRVLRSGGHTQGLLLLCVVTWWALRHKGIFLKGHGVTCRAPAGPIFLLASVFHHCF